MLANPFGGVLAYGLQIRREHFVDVVSRVGNEEDDAEHFTRLLRRREFQAQLTVMHLVRSRYHLSREKTEGVKAVGMVGVTGKVEATVVGATRVDGVAVGATGEEGATVVVRVTVVVRLTGSGWLERWRR